MTINQIKGIIRKNRKSGRCDLVVIDYLQLISPTDKKMIREQQVSEMSRVLKEITLNEKIPVICLSQLNREADNGRAEAVTTFVNQEPLSRMLILSFFRGDQVMTGKNQEPEIRSLKMKFS